MLYLFMEEILIFGDGRVTVSVWHPKRNKVKIRMIMFNLKVPAKLKIILTSV